MPKSRSKKSKVSKRTSRTSRKSASKKSRAPKKVKTSAKAPRVVKPKVVVSNIAPKKDNKWCDGLIPYTSYGVLSSLTQAQRASVLQDFDDGNYGDVYQEDSELKEFSDWSDINNDHVVPSRVIKDFFEKAMEDIPRNFKISSLAYEEMTIRLFEFINRVCDALSARYQKVITPKVIMSCMPILPLQLKLSKTVIPHDKFRKLIYAISMKDYSSQSFDDDALHLLHNIVEEYAFRLCKRVLHQSHKHNGYVQIFHIQSALLPLREFDPVPLSCNPLSDIKVKSDFTSLIEAILQKAHPDMQVSNEAKSEINELLNALAKELVIISRYMTDNFGEMKVGFIPSAVKSLLPAQLWKHAASFGKKSVDKNGSELLPGFDGKIDQFEMLTPESKIYVQAVIEYLIAEIVELAGNHAIDNMRNKIEPKDLKQVLVHDTELSALVEQRMRLYFVE